MLFSPFLCVLESAAQSIDSYIYTIRIYIHHYPLKPVTNIVIKNTNQGLSATSSPTKIKTCCLKGSSLSLSFIYSRYIFCRLLYVYYVLNFIISNFEFFSFLTVVERKTILLSCSVQFLRKIRTCPPCLCRTVSLVKLKKHIYLITPVPEEMKEARIFIKHIIKYLSNSALSFDCLDIEEKQI